MTATRPPEHTRGESAAGSPGIHTALGVIETLAARGPATLAELCDGVGSAKSTVHRVCTVLVDRGWAARRPDGCYDLGIRAIGLGARSSELPIVTAFRAVAAGLLTRHDETVALAVLDGGESVYVALEETSHPVRLVTHVGSRTPAFASASGRVVLASWSRASVNAEFGSRPLVTPTGRRLRSVDELHEILAGVRANGFAENREETAAGLHVIAAPVRNGSGVVLASLTIAMPTSRITAERRELLVADLLAAGDQLSASVAWLPAWNATSAE